MQKHAETQLPCEILAGRVGRLEFRWTTVAGNESTKQSPSGDYLGCDLAEEIFEGPETKIDKLRNKVAGPFGFRGNS